MDAACGGAPDERPLMGLLAALYRAEDAPDSGRDAGSASAAVCVAAADGSDTEAPPALDGREDCAGCDATNDSSSASLWSAPTLRPLTGARGGRELPLVGRLASVVLPAAADPAADWGRSGSGRGIAASTASAQRLLVRMLPTLTAIIIFV